MRTDALEKYFRENNVCWPKIVRNQSCLGKPYHSTGWQMYMVELGKHHITSDGRVVTTQIAVPSDDTCNGCVFSTFLGIDMEIVKHCTRGQHNLMHVECIDRLHDVIFVEVTYE